MKILPLDKFNSNGLNTSLCLGFFDGVHLGHQKIIQHTVNDALKTDRISAIFTFPSHPLSILSPERNPQQLTSFEERKSIMQNYHMDYFIWTNFDRAFSQITPEFFAEHILAKKLAARSIYIGPNYHFGKNASGNPEFLRQLGKTFGFEVHILPPVYIGNEMVSSTLLRHTLQNGEISRAYKMLGRYYSITTDKVSLEKCNPLGSLYNLSIPSGRILPQKGVFAGYVLSEELYHKAIIYIIASQTKEGNPVCVFIKEHPPCLLRKNITVYFVENIRYEEISQESTYNIPFTEDLDSADSLFAKSDTPPQSISIAKSYFLTIHDR